MIWDALPLVFCVLRLRFVVGVLRLVFCVLFHAKFLTLAPAYLAMARSNGLVPSGVKPIRSSIGWISGLDMNSFQMRPVR